MMSVRMSVWFKSWFESEGSPCPSHLPLSCYLNIVPPDCGFVAWIQTVETGAFDVSNSAVYHSTDLSAILNFSATDSMGFVGRLCIGHSSAIPLGAACQCACCRLLAKGTALLHVFRGEPFVGSGNFGHARVFP